MAKIQIQDLPVTEELSADEQKGIIGGAGLQMAGVQNQMAEGDNGGRMAPTTDVASAGSMQVASAGSMQVASAGSMQVASAGSMQVASAGQMHMASIIGNRFA